MKFIVVFILSMGFLTLSSCSRNVESRPNYVFKPAPNNEIAAKMGEFEITNQKLTQGVESDLFEAKRKVYEIKMNRLQGLILEHLIENDPRKSGLSNDQFLERYILSDARVSDQEINEFITKRAIPSEHVNEELKDRIRQYIMMEKKKEMIDQWLAQQTASTPIEVYFERPRRPTFEVEVGDAPTKGRPNAEITIVEFSDFQCPFCAKGAEIMREVKNKYGNKVRLVYKNFPLPFHQHAAEAAHAALCANEVSTDSFWKLHKEMFLNQQNLNTSGLKQKAQRVGLNVDDFTACLESGRFQSKIQQNIEQGRQLGVQSTPTYFINGQLLSGAQPLEAFSEVIDEILQ